MIESPFTGLIQNIALLLALVLVFNFVEPRLPRGRASFHQVLLGLLIGIIGVSIMLTPWVLAPGANFDTRSVLLSVSGLFFGTVPTLIAMLITAAFRIYQGGSGALTGVLVILATGTIGIAWRHLRKKPLEKTDWKEFYLFGLITHLIMLALMLTFPWVIAQNVLTKISLPVLAIYPLGTVLLGILMVNQERHKLAEGALREEQERLQFVLQGSQLGYWDWDLTTGAVKRNERWAEMLGYHLDEIEFTVKQWIDFIHPDDQARANQSIQEHLDGKTPMHKLEYRMRTKDGNFKWILDQARVMKWDSNQRPMRMSGTHTDITERKRAEDALQESEEKFRSLLDSQESNILVLDYDGVHDYVNQVGIVSLTDSGTAPEIVGKRLHDLYPAETADWQLEQVRQVLTTGQGFSGDFQNVENNQTRWWHLNLQPIRNAAGQTVRVMVNSLDITERKQIEAALRESENKSRTIIETSPDGIAISALDGTLQFVTAKLVSTLGYASTSEVIGRNMMEFVHESYQEKIGYLIQELLNGHLTGPAECLLVRKDDSHFYGEVNANILYAADKKPIGLLVVERDITARKQVEEKIQKLNNELEQLVDERTRELRNAQEQLVRQEKLAVLGQLAGGVGHELRNPLGVINNAIYYLRMAQPDAGEKIKEYLGIIETETHNANKIISDLLDFSRIKSTAVESVDIAGLVQHTLERFPTSEHVQIALDLPEDLPTIDIDPRQLTQVLGNLVLNACQSMPQGGKLSLSAKVKGEMMAIAVADTGTGITPENMKKLFEPLFTTKPKGIGLGLAVSKKLIEANNGKIEVESEVSKGTAFTIYLPLHQKCEQTPS